MSGRRVQGGLVDREGSSLTFYFEGRRLIGLPGDTIASALLANGVRIVGRSFKYHRPRGLWGAWSDDPNGIVNVRIGDNEHPNCLASTTALADGMHVRPVNAWPTARNDLKGLADLLHRWTNAGFYYKTFMWPNWHWFEPAIRKMAGLGQLDHTTDDNYIADQQYEHCELLIVGAGAAGLAAARAASEAGRQVILIDDHPQAGGGLYRRASHVEDLPPAQWIAEQREAICAAGGQILLNTTAFGIYDHGLVTLMQQHGFNRAPTLWRLRPQHTLLASGAIDRPLTFVNNDLPGVMSMQAGMEYLARYGVLVGRDIAIACNIGLTDSAAHTLADAGATIRHIHLDQGAILARGGKTLRTVRQGNARFDTEIFLTSSGWTPLVHLWSCAGGDLKWSEALAAFVPGEPRADMTVVGAANGRFDLTTALDEARHVATGKQWRPTAIHYDEVTPHWPQPGSAGRQWIDYQHDVTLDDIELAARENFTSVEHLKRYTTLGMAVDQGKTSNTVALAAMAAIQGKSIEQIGSTRFRPPFVPVPLEIYHGHRRGQLVSPLKRLALETVHRQARAAMCEYGGWLRPGWYGSGPPAPRVADEVRMARASVGVLDASSLGKIEVMGPDAESFVNFIYYNTIDTLKAGHIRYGFMLTESGIVMDDGVVARLGPERFVISCSSSHVDSVLLHLEGWRQDGNNPDRIFVHDMTDHWATVTITGPKARAVLDSLKLDIDTTPSAFAHMTLRQTTWRGEPVRIARVSFTGDASYELSIACDHVAELWAAVNQAAIEYDGGPLGLEALAILRAEKGYIVVGQDTDGETMPHDLGFGIPRHRKKAAYVGDRSLQTDKANDPNRRRLIGLRVQDGQPRLPIGAHMVTTGPNPVSIGVVTSSYDSPTLAHPIALGLLQNGDQRMGETVDLFHLGRKMTATVEAACAFDPGGARLNA